MPGSFMTSASAPTSGTFCGSWRASIARRTTSCSAPRPISTSLPSSGRTSAPSSSRRRTTHSASKSMCRWVLRRERPDVFHAPHYVLPPAVPCRSVVTIHDCIHLMFPQYLPNKAAYAYARASMWAAVKRSNCILTVSEASKRDILHFFNVAPEKIVVVYNAIDDHFWLTPPEEEVARVRERYQLDHQFVLYVGNIKPHKNLVRLDRGVRRAAPDRTRGAEAADHRRRDLQAAGAATRGAQPQAAQARAVSRLRLRRHAANSLSTRRRCSSSRRCTRGSGFRRSKRWPAARPS